MLEGRFICVVALLLGGGACITEDGGRGAGC
jgi:hypothetical protein